MVLADADLERAANGIAWGGMFNSGQACISVERVYVEAPVYDEFVAKLTDKVSRLRQGHDDRRCRYDVGAMATTAQRDIVRRHVDEAVAAGARVTTGGKPTGGRHLLPAHRARRRRSVDGLHDRGDVRPDAASGQGRRRGRGDPAGQRLELRAIRRRCGPASTRGERVARRIEAGAVNVNDVDGQRVQFRAADGRLEALRGRITQRRRGRHAEILPPTSDHGTPDPYPVPRSRCGTPTRAASTGSRWVVVRAAAAHGLRRVGLKPRGGAR